MFALTPGRRRRARLLAEVKRVAREDLDAVAEEVRALEAAAENTGGEAHDAYYRAVALHGEAVAALAVARSVAGMRAVAERSAAARHQIACARALLEGAAAPDANPPCFFDPAHGPSEGPVAFAPEGGAMRQVPACDACAEEVRAGRVPDLRRVILDGRPQPYWRSPVHGGYFLPGATYVDGVEIGIAGALAIGAEDALVDWIADWFT